MILFHDPCSCHRVKLWLEWKIVVYVLKIVKNRAKTVFFHTISIYPLTWKWLHLFFIFPEELPLIIIKQSWFENYEELSRFATKVSHKIIFYGVCYRLRCKEALRIWISHNFFLFSGVSCNFFTPTVIWIYQTLLLQFAIKVKYVCLAIQKFATFFTVVFSTLSLVVKWPKIFFSVWIFSF